MGIGGLFIGRYRSGILQRMPVRDAVEGLFMGRPTCYRSPILQRMHVGDLGGLFMGRPSFFSGCSWKFRGSDYGPVFIIQRMHVGDLGGLIMGRYRSSILQRMHIRDGVAGLWVL